MNWLLVRKKPAARINYATKIRQTTIRSGNQIRDDNLLRFVGFFMARIGRNVEQCAITSTNNVRYPSRKVLPYCTMCDTHRQRRVKGVKRLRRHAPRGVKKLRSHVPRERKGAAIPHLKGWFWYRRRTEQSSQPAPFDLVLWIPGLPQFGCMAGEGVADYGLWITSRREQFASGRSC